MSFKCSFKKRTDGERKSVGLTTCRNLKAVVVILIDRLAYKSLANKLQDFLNVVVAVCVITR